MRGYSLIECLCGICLVGMLSAVTTRFIQQASTILQETTSTIESRISLTKAALTVSAQLSALERSHLPGTVAISSGTTIRAPHGGAHPVAGVGASSQPRAESDIISVIEVDPRYRGRIRQSKYSESSIEVEVCGSPELPASTQFKSHLVVGLAGICQITGNPTPTPSGCFVVSGAVVQGLFHGSPSCPRSSLLEYLPVAREFSVYIDKTGELRLVSHVGTHILENQPMTRGLRSLRVTPFRSTSGATLFAVTISATQARQHTFMLSGALAQHSLWNEILL
jgi:hypothetical protein